MSSLSHGEIIGFLGVALLLVAFFLNLFRLSSAESLSYLVLNVIGAGLACASSYLIEFLPFVLLEGTWAMVAAVALVRKIPALECKRLRRTEPSVHAALGRRRPGKQSVKP